MKLDADGLRKELKNYFGTAIFVASPLAMADYIAVEKADDEELLEIARKNGIDIFKYLTLEQS